MPYDSRTYRILIASPSDVEEEREIAVRVIQEWNDLYSYSRSVVLLPLRWETHSAPEYGMRPQEIINRAIVDQCDLLVGVFWTRIGSPTGVAESGTIEEISRVAKAGKPIMLYFSKVGMDPDRIDLDQLNRLKAFKAETYPNALTESYKSHIEFRDKFAKQLELKVRDLQKADTSGGPPPLTFGVAAPDLKSVEGAVAVREVEALNVIDLDAAIGSAADEAAEGVRDSIEAYSKRAATVPVVLAISNTGTSGIRNLYVEMNITAPHGLVVSDKEPRHPRASVWSNLLTLTHNVDLSAWSEVELKGLDVSWTTRPDLQDGFTRTDFGWRMAFEWPALQPKRERLVAPALFVTAANDGTVTFMARIFADSLPEPVSLEARLEIRVRQRTIRAAELLGPSTSRPNKGMQPTAQKARRS